jgi:hypothetical protein
VRRHQTAHETVFSHHPGKYNSTALIRPSFCFPRCARWAKISKITSCRRRSHRRQLYRRALGRLSAGQNEQVQPWRPRVCSIFFQFSASDERAGSGRGAVCLPHHDFQPAVRPVRVIPSSGAPAGA